MSLPDGLEDTVNAFHAGCKEKGKEVANDVGPTMTERLMTDFKTFEKDWPELKYQVLAVAGLSGRLAALYADIDGKKKTVEWKHARRGLKDGQEECRTATANRAKHCRTANFEHD